MTIPWGELAICMPTCAAFCLTVDWAVGRLTRRLKMARRPTHCPSCGSKLINPVGMLHPCEYIDELFTKSGEPCGCMAAFVITKATGREVYVCAAHVSGVVRTLHPALIKVRSLH